MTENIFKFRPRDYIDNPDNILEEAAGVYKAVLVLGIDKNGEFDFRGSTADGGDILWIIEQFKHRLLAGDFL